MNTETEQHQFTKIIDDDDDDLEMLEAKDTSSQAMSYTQIYSQLLRHEALVIEIGENAFQHLRRGITDAKYNSNQKCTKAGIKSDDRRIEYVVISEDKEKQTIKVRVAFKVGAIPVLSVAIADKEM